MKSNKQKIHYIGEWLETGSVNFFGRQFAGKDTQAARLASYFNAPVIGGGEILRNSEIPDDVRATMDRGELISSEAYKQMMIPYLSQTALQDKPLFLSSVGRTLHEHADVLEATETSGHPIKTVPYLDISEEEAFRRLLSSPSRGRIQDCDEGLKVRMLQFRELTLPVIDAYESAGLLVKIDGMQPENMVFRALVNSLYDRARER